MICRMLEIDFHIKIDIVNVVVITILIKHGATNMMRSEQATDRRNRLSTKTTK